MTKCFSPPRNEEFYARECLEHLFPQRCFNLEISDRPDLQRGCALGIEVVDSAAENFRKAQNAWINIGKTSDKKACEKYKETMKKCGYPFESAGIQSFGCSEYIPGNIESNETITAIFHQFTKKVEKLQSYKDMEEYDLVIIAYDFNDMSVLAQLTRELQKRNIGTKKYTYVYLLLAQALCVLNLYDGHVTRFDMDQFGMTQPQLAVIAHNKYEEAKKNEQTR